MTNQLPKRKLNSNMKSRLDTTSISQTTVVAWLNYQLFLKALSTAAAEKAREDKTAVIREHHVKLAAKDVLKKFKG